MNTITPRHTVTVNFNINLRGMDETQKPVKVEMDESSESIESSSILINPSQVVSDRNCSCCTPQVSVGCQCDISQVKHSSEDEQDDHNTGDEVEGSIETEGENVEEIESENSENDKEEVNEYSEEEYAEPDNTEGAENEDSMTSEEDTDTNSSSRTTVSFIQRPRGASGVIEATSQEFDVVSHLAADKAAMTRQIKRLKATLADQEQMLDQVLTQIHYVGPNNTGNGDGDSLNQLGRRLANILDSCLTAILNKLPANPTQTNSEASDEPSCAHALPRRSSRTATQNEEVAAPAPSNAGSTNPLKMKVSRIVTRTSSVDARKLKPESKYHHRTAFQPARPQMSPVPPRKVKKVGEITSTRKGNDKSAGGKRAPPRGPRRS